jgi:hypothetical protein
MGIADNTKIQRQSGKSTDTPPSGAIDTITPTTIARLVERQDRQTPRTTQFLGRWIADGRRSVTRRQRSL